MHSTYSNAIAQSNASRGAAASNEWPTYGHDPGGQRFSPLTQLTSANVNRLQVAWVYHMRPAPAADSASLTGAAGQGRGGGRGGSGFAASETTPLVVDGVDVHLTHRMDASSRSIRRLGRRPGISEFRPAMHRHGASNTGPEMRRRLRRSCSGQVVADSFRSMRRRASQTTRSAITAAST